MIQWYKDTTKKTLRPDLLDKEASSEAKIGRLVKIKTMNHHLQLLNLDVIIQK